MGRKLVFPIKPPWLLQTGLSDSWWSNTCLNHCCLDMFFRGAEIGQWFNRSQKIHEWKVIPGGVTCMLSMSPSIFCTSAQKGTREKMQCWIVKKTLTTIVSTNTKGWFLPCQEFSNFDSDILACLLWNCEVYSTFVEWPKNTQNTWKSLSPYMLKLARKT